MMNVQKVLDFSDFKPDKFGIVTISIHAKNKEDLPDSFKKFFKNSPEEITSYKNVKIPVISMKHNVFTVSLKKNDNSLIFSNGEASFITRTRGICDLQPTISYMKNAKMPGNIDLKCKVAENATLHISITPYEDDVLNRVQEMCKRINTTCNEHCITP